MGTRIEIYKDGEWQQLILSNKRAIKYNVVINKIGKISTREISHTNTFSLPDFHQNRKSLGLNTFNVRDLAKAMNTKYECKYYVEDKVIQEGYLVINNTNNGLINVNFMLVGYFFHFCVSNRLEIPWSSVARNARATLIFLLFFTTCSSC